MNLALCLGAARATSVVHPVEGWVLWRTLLRGNEGATCDWCNMSGRLAIYTWRGPARDIHIGGRYCSLHCWGQRYGYTDL